MNKKKSINLSVGLSLFLIVILAFFLTSVMFVLQTNGLGDLKRIFIETKGLTFLLNFLPVLLLLFIIFFISNNFVLSSSIVSIIVLASSFVNRYKIQLRQDPFLPWDFYLLNEVTTILEGFDLKDFITLFLVIIFIIIITILALRFIKTDKINLLKRFITAFIFIIISFILNKQIYSNVRIFDNLFVLGNIYNQTDSFNSKGFIYSFIYTSNMNKLKKFDGYEKTIVVQLENEYKKTSDISYDKPHIFMIMGEAFSEIGDNQNINYDGFEDPLANFKKIKEDSLYGHIVVPALGGGTADTEFDVLTGVNTRNFRGAPFSYRIVNKDMSSVASILNNLGYENVAIHPGHPWFYNRLNVYNFFGFSKFIDIGNYPDESMYKGMYVKETNTFDTIIEEFENHLNESDKPFFDFCVTIQNHGPYKDKYLVDTNFNTDLPLSDDNINALSNYFEGLKDMDLEIKKFVDYMNNSTEPIVLLYFGDHLPGFSQDVYNLLVDNTENKLEEITNRYSIPYFIIQNKACKEIVDFDETIKNIKLPSYNRISSNYLGAVLLELLNFSSSDSFFTYTLEALKEYPIILEKQYFDSEGNIHEIEPDNTFLNNYKYWQYYKIFDEKQ